MVVLDSVSGSRLREDPMTSLLLTLADTAVRVHHEAPGYRAARNEMCRPQEAGCFIRKACQGLFRGTDSNP